MIQMEYNEREKQELREIEGKIIPRVGPVVLMRTNKQWTAAEENKIRGLYPHEIRLINMLQENIIKDWNAQDKE